MWIKRGAIDSILQVTQSQFTRGRGKGGYRGGRGGHNTRGGYSESGNGHGNDDYMPGRSSYVRGSGF